MDKIAKAGIVILSSKGVNDAHRNRSRPRWFFELKEQITSKLRDSGFEVEDYGAHRLTHGDDYPDFVIPLAKDIALKRVERGIVICGSGIDACIAANKIPGVWAGTVHDGYSAH